MSAYLINRSVGARSGNKTPEEIWSDKKVDLSDLKIFGTKVMVHVPKQKRKKLDFKSKQLIFVGYDGAGYRCIDKDTRKLTISRDVIFHEEFLDPTINVSIDEVKELDVLEKENTNNYTSASIIKDDNGEESAEDEQTIDLTEMSPRSVENDETYLPVTNSSDAERSPIKTRAKSKHFSTTNLINFAFFIDPGNVSDALNCHESKEWKNAMTEEYKSLEINKTWTLVDLPQGKKTIKAKWVFKTKVDDNGQVVRYKARLVAKGYSQRYGIDYTETYSPVVRYTSIRYLLAMAVKKKYKIHQMDVVTAFLQGDLNEEIYMDQPEIFNDGTNRVCKLNKSIYGLKQAGRQWNIKLDEKLRIFGLIKSKTDPCIYYTNNLGLMIAIYVDDFLIFFKEIDELNKLKEFLNKEFLMKDLGEAKSCLGIKITQGENYIEIDQIAYIREILNRFGMEDCKPVGTPRDINQKLSINDVDDKNSLVGKIPYQEAIGSLLYLTQGTRPDIAFAVNDLSRFNLKHGEVHWQAIKRIFRYLSGTINYKLRYSYNDTDGLCAFSDADWASEVDQRRSCTGFVIKMSNGAISWSSKRQPIVALSSTEAEYIALSSTIREVIWLKQFQKEIDENHSTTTIVYCDNQSTIKLAENDGYRPRTKHIDIRFHHLREHVENKIIKIDYLPTQNMLADLLTKPTTKEKLIFCINEMGLKQHY